MLHTFSCCDRLTKSTLFNSFCLSLSGSAIWSLTCPQLKSLEVTFNNILRKIWSLPRRCHTSLMQLTVDSVFNTVYNKSLKLVNSAINSDSIILHDVFYQSSKLVYCFTGYLDGSTLNFTLNKILFVPASCVMSWLTRHSITLLSVRAFFLPAVHSSFFSYFVCICLLYCVACSSSLLSFLLVSLLLLCYICSTTPLLECFI